MILSDEMLMAYADGELDATTRQQIQDAINSDPEIARRVASHETLRDAVRSSFESVLGEAVPDRLIEAARTKTRASSQPNVVPLHRNRWILRPWPQGAALAASFVLGALALHFGPSLSKSYFITERNGQVLASGALAQALSNQLSGAQQTQAPVQIGVSFLSKSGRYCRTFQMQQSTPVSGLACNDAGSWELEILARSEASTSSNAEYRPAGSALPPAVVRTVNDLIAGDPLDAESEARAREQHWRSH